MHLTQRKIKMKLIKKVLNKQKTKNRNHDVYVKTRKADCRLMLQMDLVYDT